MLGPFIIAFSFWIYKNPKNAKAHGQSGILGLIAERPAKLKIQILFRIYIKWWRFNHASFSKIKVFFHYFHYTFKQFIVMI